MDAIEGLISRASALSAYDIKSYVTQAKNAVLNISPMEAKVREATDPDEPWGASSTLMQEIAQATHNFQQFNEILPLIWSRFHESEARQWRQIYKALTLLEYLVKNGSERVVDDARSHVATIKMLRSFHYIDDKGKDQGINVRNRAKEIVELLSDVERIRAERRKAKQNKNKYQGTGSDGFAGGGGFGGTGSRYGGFGSDRFGDERGGSRDQYGGSAGGIRSRGDDYDSGDVYRSSNRQRQSSFDDYDAGDDEDRAEPTRQQRSGPNSRSGASSRSSQPASKAPQRVVKEIPEPAPKVQDLFDFGDDEPSIAAAGVAAAPAATQSKLLDDDDDFADFQGATPSPAPQAAPAQSKAGNVFDFLDAAPLAPAQTSNHTPAAQNTPFSSIGAGGSASPAYGSNVPNYNRPMMNTQNSSSFGVTQVKSPAQSKPASSGFDDLWSSSLSAVGGSSNAANNSSAKKSMMDLDREKTMGKLWGASPGGSATRSGGMSVGGFGAKQAPKDDFGDLLG